MNSENNDTLVCTSKEFEIDNIKRCNKCNKLPLIEIIQKKDKYLIILNCGNIEHKYVMNLEDFLNDNNNSINKIDCFECKKKQENNEFFNFFIVYLVKKFYVINVYLIIIQIKTIKQYFFQDMIQNV